MPSASPSARDVATTIAPAARPSLRRSLPTRANAPSRIRRRPPSGATSSPIAVGCSSTSRPTKGSRRRFRRKRTGAFALTSEPKENAIGRTEPNSSRSTKRRSGSSPTGLRPMAPTSRRRARQRESFRWPRRLKGSPTRRSRSMADCRSTRVTVPTAYSGSFASRRGRTTSS